MVANMKRGPMLYMANVDEVRFKVLRKREQLPFIAPEGNAYTPDHAFRLRLMLDLIGGEDDGLGGLPPSAAAPLVAEALRFYPVHPLRQFTPHDWWAGVVVLERAFIGVDGQEESERWAINFFGEIENFSDWLDEARTFKSGDLSGRYNTVRVFLANMSRAAQVVQSRAEEIGIDLFAIEPEST